MKPRTMRPGPLPQFGHIKDVCWNFGYPTEDAMRAAFTRGILPADCLVRVGERRVFVDTERLTTFFRTRIGAHAQPEVAISKQKCEAKESITTPSRGLTCDLAAGHDGPHKSAVEYHRRGWPADKHGDGLPAKTFIFRIEWV